MKIVISIDSFKGSLTSMEAGEAFRDGSIKAAPDADVVVKPLADGGEGTAEALVEGMGGVWIRTEVSGPQKERREISYGWFPENRLAVMEMAAAAGLTLLPEGERNALYTTTYGVGEMIRDALERGARQFLLGIGGSATNDCGLGMMTALGIKFLDAGGKEAGITGEDTGRVRKIDCSGLIPQLRECRFQVFCAAPRALPMCTARRKVFLPISCLLWMTVTKISPDVRKKRLGRTSAAGRERERPAGSGYLSWLFWERSCFRGQSLSCGPLGLKRKSPGQTW